MTSLADIRSTFLNYFDEQGHARVESGPLVPRNDPTLMFTNSGMVQFKNLFTGVETRDYSRATSSQKCVRAGGKHNDLDNVGMTARHLTFFEMLGNFSFGDYFKQDAIPFAWEMVTKQLGIPKEKLLVTVYHTDEEAADLWKKVAGLPDERIIRIATDDNFWRMGPTGPCGPCTEIFYDHGDHIWGGPPGSPEEDGDRFIEIWNLVFMQSEQHEDGTLTDLPQQSIDTGMGLERISSLLQGTNNVFETDLMMALVTASADATSTGLEDDILVHHRVIADHLRSTSFLIAEGVLPSNEGRGYVLRRIMRRAMRHAHLLGAVDPVMHRLVPALVQQMGAAYPELSQGQSLIEETLRNEEIRFKQTLDRGLKLLSDEVSGLGEGAPLPGASAFKLYDTYGFPLDLTQDALRENNRDVDVAGFQEAMDAQKAKARAAWSGTGATADATVWFNVADTHGTTEFLGYETENAEGQITALIVDGSETASANVGQSVHIAVNQTPFYAESGGQVGDTGTVTTETGTAEITDTKKVAGVFVHMAEVTKGDIHAGQGAVLSVDPARRSAIRANHSATHLLHEALRGSLGEHVAQKGSLNAPDRLRFDFSHNSGLTVQQIADVERDVNAYIRQNTAVETRLMTPDDARDLGAQALFGEKYGDEVRVVSMGRQDASGKGADGNTYSLELCGGTHVRNTGDIGAFVVLGDSASSSGVRRIEALTGQAALDHLRAQDAALVEIAAAMKAPVTEVSGRVKALIEDRKALANEVAQLRRDMAMGGGAAENSTESVSGVTFLGQALSGVSGKDLPALVDGFKENAGSGVALLIADAGGKAAIACGVTSDLTDRFDAVTLLRVAVAALGGKGGGGRADMAQGGAASAEHAAQAIAAVKVEMEKL